MGGLVLFVIVLVVLVIVLPIVSIVRTSRMRTDMERLANRVAELEAQRRTAATTVPEVLRTGDERVSDRKPETLPRETPPLVSEPEEAETEALGREPLEAEEVQGAREAYQPAEPGLAEPVVAGIASAPKKSGWEERIASSWMIWLGGATVALAAVFLFRYAIDQGWLTPLTRVILGLILGGGLLAAGEWTQRTPAEGAARVVRPDYVPPALSAAGIFAIFVSLYAAHGLYGLLGAATAFIALGLVAYSALVLSLRQGWFVALLGILAGYLVPALIISPESNAVASFVYLFVLTLGALAVMVWREWRWFSALTILGSLAWPYLWTMGPWTIADQGTLSTYVLGLAAAFAALSTRLPLPQAMDAGWRWVVDAAYQSSGIGFALSGATLVFLAMVADFNAAAFMFVVLYAALSLGLGLWRASLESLFAMAALVALSLVLIWPEPLNISPPTRVQEVGVSPVSNAFGPFVMPPEFYAFSRTLWAFAAVFGLGGFFALSRVRAIPLWSAVSAFIPVLLFVIGYWRIGNFEIDIAWASWAAGLAVLELLAATAVARSFRGDRRKEPLAFYAAGVTATIALAFTCLLREAWLTVALAAEVAAIAWIWSLLKVRELRVIATLLLAVVVVRLIGNPLVLEYEGSAFGMFAWVLYGYGLPALASVFAARLFQAEGERDLTVTLCEIAGIGFAFLMVALQLKIWTSGSIYTARMDLLDGAMQANWWIIASALLLHRRFTLERHWAVAAGLAVLAAGAALVFLGLVFANNPLFTWAEVGRWPIINLLGVAYLLPALLFAAIAANNRLELPEALRPWLFGASGVLAFVYLTLEVRRAFWGSVMMLFQSRAASNAEIYAYSVAWIIFALLLLGLGIVRRSQALRYASLAVLLVTVVKVFLYDMSDLTGLYRVASFLGLGLTLIGIGRVYRVFVFTGKEDESSDRA